MTNYGYVPPNAGSVNEGVRIALAKSLAALQGAVSADANAYTDAQIAAIPPARYQAVTTASTYSGTPVNGSLVYETTNSRFQLYNGSSWGHVPFALGRVGVVTNATDNNTSTYNSWADCTGMNVTWTALAGRRYKYTVVANCYSTADADSLEVVVTDNSGTTVGGPFRYAEKSPSAGTTPVWSTHTWVDCETGIAAGSVTRKLRYRKEGPSTGGGTVHVGGGAPGAMIFLVEDIGT